MPAITNDVVIRFELDTAALKNALAEIQACTSRAAKEISAAFKDISPALEDLRSRFQALNAEISKVRLDPLNLQFLKQHSSAEKRDKRGQTTFFTSWGCLSRLPGADATS